jgi:hypothetical protein
MLAGHGSGGDGQPRDLYAQADAARQQAQLLAGQLRAAKQEIKENWQLIEATWVRAERIRALRLGARTDRDRLRYSAYARLQSRLNSLPVIEQAKGIIMAQCGWTEEQAFDALRRTSQQGNVKVRDLAAAIVARTADPASAQRPAGPGKATAQSGDEVIPLWVPLPPTSVPESEHTRDAAG